MHELTNPVVKYLEEDHLYVLNLSGKMDEHKLDESAKLLRSILESNLDKGKVIKLLVDFRETLWDSEKTHVEARKIMGQHLQRFHEYRGFSAILNNQRDFPISENEAFFTEEREALNWLRSRQ